MDSSYFSDIPYLTLRHYVVETFRLKGSLLLGFMWDESFLVVLKGRAVRVVAFILGDVLVVRGISCKVIV